MKVNADQHIQLTLEPSLLPLGDYRVLTPADIPAIYDLYRRCDDYFLLQDGEQATPRDVELLFNAVPSTRSPDDQIVIGFWQDLNLYGLAAVLTGYPQAEDTYLGLLLLDPSSRNRGFGRKIYPAVEHWASLNGARRMLVAVIRDNEAALRFWGHLGFDKLRVTGPTHYKHKAHVVTELTRSLA